MQCFPFEGCSEIIHTSPLPSSGKSADLWCLSPELGMCARCLPVHWLSSQPQASRSCRNCRGEKHLGISLALLTYRLFLTLPLATSNSSGPVEKIFMSLCHLTNVSGFFPFLFFLFPFPSFLSILLLSFLPFLLACLFMPYLHQVTSWYCSSQ